MGGTTIVVWYQCCSLDLLARDRDLTTRDRDKTLGIWDQDKAFKTETLDIRDRDWDWDLQCKSCVKTLKGVGEIKLHINTWFYVGCTLLAYTGYPDLYFCTVHEFFMD